MNPTYFNDIQFGYGMRVENYRDHLDWRRSSFSIEFISEGSMYWSINNGSRIVLDRPTAYWHNPNHTYQYGPTNKIGWTQNFVTFYGPRARRIVETGLTPLSEQGFVYVRHPKLFGDLMTTLIDIIQENDPQRHGEAVLLLERLVCILIDQNRHPDLDNPHQTDIEQIALMVRNAPQKNRCVDELARLAHLSPTHFRRLFRSYMGRPIHDYILSCRMQFAIRRLAGGGTTVTQVSQELGYDDVAQFSKLFKKRVGVSPRQYRRPTVSTPACDADPE